MSLRLYSLQLLSPDWERLVRWYRDALGLRVFIRVIEDRYAQLDGGGVQLAILQEPFPTSASPRWSLAFELEDLEPAAARLQSLDWPFERRPPNLEGLAQLKTSDPDGNVVRLFRWPR